MLTKNGHALLPSLAILRSCRSKARFEEWLPSLEQKEDSERCKIQETNLKANSEGDIYFLGDQLRYVTVDRGPSSTFKFVHALPRSYAMRLLLAVWTLLHEFFKDMSVSMREEYRFESDMYVPAYLVL